MVMKFLVSELFEKRHRSPYDEDAVLAVNESLHNITEGSEFIDDAIRMKEQPFVYPYTEEVRAAESPKNL